MTSRRQSLRDSGSKTAAAALIMMLTAGGVRLGLQVRETEPRSAATFNLMMEHFNMKSRSRAEGM